MNPTLLAFDTSTEYCSAALLKDGQILSLYEHCPNQHAATLLGMIDNLLQQAQIQLSDIDAIAFGCGPGSFTGVRIAISIAQGLAFGIQKPVIPISTLNIMAQYAHQQYGLRQVLVALDARMQQMYYGEFALDSALVMQQQGELQLLFVNDVDVTRNAKVGNGWGVDADYPNVFPIASAAIVLAEKLFEQNKMIDPALIQPIYLRNNVAQKQS